MSTLSALSALSARRTHSAAVTRDAIHATGTDILGVGIARGLGRRRSSKGVGRLGAVPDCFRRANGIGIVWIDGVAEHFALGRIAPAGAADGRDMARSRQSWKLVRAGKRARRVSFDAMARQLGGLKGLELRGSRAAVALIAETLVVGIARHLMRSCRVMQLGTLARSSGGPKDGVPVCHHGRAIGDAQTFPGGRERAKGADNGRIEFVRVEGVALVKSVGIGGRVHQRARAAIFPNASPRGHLRGV